MICALSLLGITGAALAQETEPGTPAPAEWKNSITVGVGAYRMARSTQDMNITGAPWSGGGCVLLIFCYNNSGYSYAPLANHFDTSARAALSVDYEREIKYGMAYGGGVLLTQTPFTVAAPANARGTMTGTFFFGTFAKYFGEPGSVRPFIGIGAGLVSANLGGGTNSRASGAAAEAMLGLRYRTGRISFAAEYRRIATNQMTFGDGTTLGSYFGHVNLSGQGAFLGLGIHF